MKNKFYSPIFFTLLVAVLTSGLFTSCPKPDEPPAPPGGVTPVPGSASPFTIADFESDTAGTTAYTLVGTGSVTNLDAAVIAIGNTVGGATAGNSSTNVLEIGPPAYNHYAKLPVTLPEGNAISDYNYILVKAVLPDTNAQNDYKRISAFLADSIDDGAFIDSNSTSFTGSSVMTGSADSTWRDYLIPITSTVAATISGSTFDLAIGINRDGPDTAPYYLDDITLLPQVVAKIDFESDTAGTTAYTIVGTGTATSLTGTVINIANTIDADDGGITTGTTTGNSSTNVLEVGSTDFNQYIKLTVTLPGDSSMTDFGYFCVQAVIPDNGGDNQYKTVSAYLSDSIDDAAFLDDTSNIYAGDSMGMGDYSTAWIHNVIPIPPAVASAVTGSTFQIAIGINRSGTATGPYYLDNIGLIAK